MSPWGRGYMEPSMHGPMERSLMRSQSQFNHCLLSVLKRDTTVVACAGG